jgi:hypothetical protein
MPMRGQFCTPIDSQRRLVEERRCLKTVSNASDERLVLRPCSVP